MPGRDEGPPDRPHSRVTAWLCSGRHSHATYPPPPHELGLIISVPGGAWRIEGLSALPTVCLGVQPPPAPVSPQQAARASVSRAPQGPRGVGHALCQEACEASWRGGPAWAPTASPAAAVLYSPLHSVARPQAPAPTLRGSLDGGGWDGSSCQPTHHTLQGETNSLITSNRRKVKCEKMDELVPS